MPARKPAPKRKPGGQAGPRKLTVALIEKVALHIRNGSYVETAAVACGIHKDTFYDWLKRGAAGETDLHVQFLRAVEQAEAEFETTAVERITAAGDWQATAWRLERRFPEKFGRRNRVEHTTPDGPVEVKLSFDPHADNG